MTSWSRRRERTRGDWKDMIEHRLGQGNVKIGTLDKDKRTRHQNKNECKDRIIIQDPGAWVGCTCGKAETQLTDGNFVLLGPHLRRYSYSRPYLYFLHILCQLQQFGIYIAFTTADLHTLYSNNCAPLTAQCTLKNEMIHRLFSSQPAPDNAH